MRIFLMIFITSCILWDCKAQQQSLLPTDCNEKIFYNFSLILSFDTSYRGRVTINYNKEKGKSHSDTSKIKDNKCLFSGTLTEPAFLYIEFPDMPAGSNEFFRTCIITKGLQKMDIDAKQLEQAYIHGSINDSAFMDYRNTINPLTKKLRALEQQDTNALKHSAIKDSIRLQQENILNKATEKFKIYNSYWIAAYILYSLQYDLPPDSLKDLYNTLPNEIKCSIFGKEVSNIIQRQVGNIAPDFVAVSSTEDKFQFNKISDSSKLTLLYFWATWCVPCKVLLPYLDTLHKKYGRSGLSIIAVANDDERRTTWLSTIKKLNIDYMTHVLQRFGMEDDIGSLYATMAIPVVILVDNNRTIIYRVLGTEIEPMKDFIDAYFENID